MSHALFYDGKALKDLGTFGGTSSYSIALNNRGDVVGMADIAVDGVNAGSAGFLSHAGGPLINLGVMPGTSTSKPIAIDDAGQVVGTANFGAANSHGCLEDHGVFTDLSTLLPPTSKIDATQALGINNKGQILVQGDEGGSPWPQLFLLTPDGQPIPASPDPLIQITPEPGTWAIFGAPAAGLAARRRRPRRRTAAAEASQAGPAA